MRTAIAAAAAAAAALALAPPASAPELRRGKNCAAAGNSPCNRVRLCHPKRWAETNDAFHARLSRELM
jgi:hypothetical protein